MKKILLLGLICALAFVRFTGAASGGDEQIGETHPMFRQILRLVQKAPEPNDRLNHLLLLAKVSPALEQPALTEECYRAALRAATQCYTPDHEIEQVAKVCLQSGFPEIALSAAEKVTSRNIQVDLMLGAARALAADGRSDEAIKTLQRVENMLNARRAASPKDTKSSPDAMARSLIELTISEDPFETAKWTVLVAGAYADIGRPDRAEALLQSAMTNIERFRKREAFSSACEMASALFAQLGLRENARETAAKIESPLARMQALLNSSVAARQSGHQEVSDALWNDAAAIAPLLGPGSRIKLLLELASEQVRKGAGQAAVKLLRAAEELANSKQRRSERASDLPQIAALYDDLGYHGEAARLASESSAPINACLYRIKQVVALTQQQEPEAARQALKKINHEHIQYADPDLLRKLAKAYLALYPDVTPEHIAQISSEQLRGMVRLIRATQAAAQGDYPLARQLLDPIATGLIRGDAYEEAALAAIKRAGSVEAPGTVEFVTYALGNLQKPEKQIQVILEVGMLQVKLGRTQGVENTIKALQERIDTWDWNEGEARGLTDVAILLYGIDRKEEAISAVRKGVKAAFTIGCAGCRKDTLRNIFSNLARPTHAELLKAALQTLPEPSMKVDYIQYLALSIRDLKIEDKRAILQMGIQQSLQLPLGVRPSALARIAAAYVAADLTPGEQEEELIRNAPPPAPPQAPLKEQFRLPPPTKQSPDMPAILVYFHRRGCGRCKEAESLIDKVTGKQRLVTVMRLDADSKKNTERFKALCIALQLPEHKHLLAPAIFGPRGALVDEEITPAALQELIDQSRGYGDPLTLYAIDLSKAEQELKTDYRSLGLIVVLSAGLVDGVNPCAFTVIIFLLSYLTYMGKKRSEIIWVGGIFTVAVFLTYFAAGLGFAWLMKVSEQWSSIFAVAFQAAAALLALVAAFLSFHDAYKCSRGETGHLALSLPDKLNSKIRLTISKKTRMGLTIGATFILGALVALFELPCTGQAYLPTIIYGLHNLPGHLWGPVGWLLLYNLCFILPLVLILIALFFGLTSETLTGWFRKHIAATKVALGLVFTMLFIVLVAQWL